MVEAAAIGNENYDVFGGMFEFVLIVAEVFTLLGIIEIILMGSILTRQATGKGNAKNEQTESRKFKYMLSYLHKQTIITIQQVILNNYAESGLSFLREKHII